MPICKECGTGFDIDSDTKAQCPHCGLVNDSWIRANSKLIKLLGLIIVGLSIVFTIKELMKTDAELYEESLSSKKYAQAEMIARRLVARDKNDRYLDMLGYTLREQNKLKEAEETYLQAIQYLQNKGYPFEANYSHLTKLGVIYYRQNKLEKAIATYRQAIKSQPKHTYPYNHLGVVLRNQGKYEEAEKMHRQAIAIRFENTIAHILLGRALAAQKKFDPAMEAYNTALDIFVDEGTQGASYLGIANILKEQKKFTEAIVNYQKVLNLQDGHDSYEPFNSSHAQAHAGLGEIYQQQGQLQAALKEYNQALTLDPNLVVVRNNIQQVQQLLKL